MVRSNKKKLSRKRTTSKSKKPHKHTKKQNKRLKQPKKTKTLKTKRKTRKLKRKSRKLKGGIVFDRTTINPLYVNHHAYIEPLKKFPELTQTQTIHSDNKTRVYFYFEQNDKIYLFKFLYDNNDEQNILDNNSVSLIILKDNTKNEEEQYVDEDLNILTTTDLEDGDFFNELNTFINANLKNKKANTLTSEKKTELQTILTKNILQHEP